MLRANFALVILIVCVGALVACGGGGGTLSMQNPGGGGMVPMSLTIRDNPPMGVTVLSFEIQITGAALQPSGAGMQAVPLMTKPAEVELEHLQTESALLANVNVPAGNYNGVTVSFASPQLTILNQTGAALNVGGQNCPNMQICELNPTLNAAMASVQAPTAPFPIMLSMNSPVELRMDFNVNTSIQENDLSITPAISVQQIQKAEGDEDEIRLIGVVKSIDSMMGTFTVQDFFTGNTSTLSTNNNTEFDFEDACNADNFTCLQTGQVVRVKAQQQQDGSLLATKVRLFAEGNQLAIEGTVTAINSGANSFQIVIANEDGFSEDQMRHGGIGMPLTVILAPAATFAIDATGLSLPAGLNFASLADMMVGQSVRIHPTGLTVMGTPPNISITTDQVHLEPAQLTGTIMAINGNATPPMFTLGILSPLFTNSGTSTLQVDVLSTTRFEDVSGLSGLNGGNTVSVEGLLFKSTNPPTVVAEKIFRRESD
ncbi:MAG TPA: DUF5666 domain-containing protein [Candidatus Limnocylindria bacterium]|nr:DUF5666 domain-containing protein [Candidatus Limnocylindria bacterium]